MWAFSFGRGTPVDLVLGSYDHPWDGACPCSRAMTGGVTIWADTGVGPSREGIPRDRKKYIHRLGLGF